MLTRYHCHPLKVDNLQIGELNIAVAYKNMRAIRLRVCAPSGDVKVSAPRGVRREVVQQFVSSRLNWIREHQQKIRNRPPARVWQRFDKATQQQYRAQLLEQLPPLIARYEKLLHVSVASFNFRHMKTRWGS